MSFRKTGYSLPELLITILLVAVLVVMALAFSNGMSQTKRLKDYSIAVAFAQQAIEIIRAAPFTLLDDADAGSNSVETDFSKSSGINDLIEPEFVSGGITYKRTVEISDVMAKEDDKRPIGLKLVKVTVNWTTMEGNKVEPFVIKTTIANLN